MRGLIGGDDVRRQGRRRLWPLILFLVLMLVLGAWTAVNRVHEAREQAPAVRSSAIRSAGRPRKKAQGDGDAATLLSAPKAWPATARKVVRATLGWRKAGGAVRHVGAQALLKAGMTSGLARSYEPVWDRVFAPAVSADLHAGSASIQVEPGATVGRDQEYEVAVAFEPTWRDRKGRTAHVRPGQARWTVTVDHATGRVSRLVEPDPTWLWFALPSDGLIPSGAAR